MLVAFVESIKYIGHMVPIAFLRIFLGYFYINRALTLFHGDFFTHAYIAEDIRAHLPKSEAPEWFKHFLEFTVVPNWQPAAYAIVIGYTVIGISYIIGYLVRPISFFGLVLSLFMLWSVEGTSAPAQPIFLIVLHMTMAWAGAGRCLGIDYYFYKRRRGLWW